MQTIYNKTIVACCAMMMLTITACKKFLDVGEPMDRITTENAFSNDQSATSAVLGVYSQMMITTPYIMSAGTTMYAGLSADELEFTGTSTAVLAFQTNTIPSNSSTISNDLWQRAYVHIYHINAGLKGLAESKAVSAGVKQQLTGELLFLRAYVYHYLVNFFGDVPWVGGTVYEENAVIARTPKKAVYGNMIADLEQAKTMLGTTHPSAAKGRPTRYSASALLARVYLYQQEWSKAESEAGLVITSGTASMVSNLNNVFLANSAEALWQLVPTAANFNTTEGLNFIPAAATVRPNFAVSSSLLNAFAANDLRKTAWLKFNTVGGTPYYYPFKYKVRMNAAVTEHYMMLRLAEQYLVRAEARAEQDNISGAQADLNVIRTRAGLSATTANTKALLRAAIEQERRLELFAEWGHRWFDLKRTGRADAVLQPLKPSWQSYAVLYPIPQSQIERNSALTQNPGY